MTKIKMKESIEDKNSWFNVKRFSISGLKEDFSKKTVDVNNITKTLYENTTELQKGEFIFQKSKTIKNIESVKEIINQEDNTKIKNYFGWRGWLKDKFTILTFTLDFNPFDSIKKIEDLSGFFQYYYSYSGKILFIPNIRRDKDIFSNGKKQGNREIINLDGYKKFVSQSFDFFSQKNNKPIFVPISLRFGIGKIEELIKFYLKNENFLFWIDFEGKAIDEAQTAKIREINRVLKDEKRFDETLIVFNNMKREIRSNIKEDKSPASDVLGPLYGANIVGVDKEPARYFGPNFKPEEVIFEHKARKFDEKTYYYKKTTDNKFLTKHKNVTNNSIELGNEFLKQRKYFLKKQEIENYIKTKEMIIKYNKGRILSDIKKNLLKQGSLKKFLIN
ncbi:MAG: hypothetical protein ABIE55_02525 [Candidatus Aenigmatarchaeota archaeon]